VVDALQLYHECGSGCRACDLHDFDYCGAELDNDKLSELVGKYRSRGDVGLSGGGDSEESCKGRDFRSEGLVRSEDLDDLFCMLQLARAPT
jgi:hypothetical protein